MRIGKVYKLQIALCVLILSLCVCTERVNAAQGAVSYGSESYTWYVEESSPIGVYISSDSVIESYEICLEYDDTMLHYLDGAELQDGNHLYIHGGGDKMAYSHMLHFEPLCGGNTTIRVVSAQARTKVDDVNLQPQIDIIAMAEAPIEIIAPVSNRLSAIYIDDEQLEGFESDIYEYELQVGAEIERLPVSYDTQDKNAMVYLSDTTLAYGENTVRMCVRGTDGETEYILYVIRTEEVSEDYKEELQETEEEIEEIEIEEIETETELNTEITAIPTIITDVLEEPESTDVKQTPVAEQEDVATGNQTEWVVLGSLVIATTILLIVYIVSVIKDNRLKKKIQLVEQVEEADVKVINLDQTVIKVDHVTMRFKQMKDEASSLKEHLIRAIKRQNQYQYLTALNDVSFEVKQGDVVGIIGTNGSGKSTLLKIVSGALRPTQGSVDVEHRKVQLLTLGTGFDMELTARENVYLNGAIIGYSKEYIDEKYDDIVAFAELDGFMDERMKNFSSGMVSRLGFAIATMRDAPDILILDEVMAVGDMFFRKKSEERIKELIHSGATVLIVSHAMDVILKNCNKAVWLEKGVLQVVGEPQAVCDAYKNSGK